MFTKNVGSIDKMARIVFGIVLIALVLFSGLPMFATGFMHYAPLVVGGVLIVTAFINFCPLYSVLGINTRRA